MVLKDKTIITTAYPGWFAKLFGFLRSRLGNRLTEKNNQVFTRNSILQKSELPELESLPPKSDPQRSLPAMLPINSWNSGLADMASKLDNLSKSTEKEFLYLGERLNHINTINNQNAALADKVITTLNTGKAADLKSIRKALNDGFSKADQAENALSDLSVALGKMEANIGAITELNESLDRTYRALRMVRVMIRIETENAGCLEFNTVADDLTTLEELITGNAGEIKNASTETVDLIQKILSRIENKNRSNQLSLVQEQGKIQEQMSVISGKVERSINTCQQMGGFINSISSAIGEIVTYLQFHDNYRQRLEHISHNLSEVQSDLSGFATGTEKDLSKLRAWATAVLNLQMAQLQNLKNENIEVSGNLSQSFTRILNLMQKQSDTADQIIPTMMSLEQDIGKLDELLKEFYSHLGDYKKVNYELMNSTDLLSKHVSGITRVSSLIESNELNLRLLALNSMIKASAIGRLGKPLAVLSTEINTISQSVQHQISDRLDIISSISSDSNKITGDLLLNLRESMQTVDESFDRIGTSILTLLQTDENASNCSAATRRLKADFSDLVDKLQFSRAINEGLDHVMKGLENICQQFKEHLPQSEQGIDLIDPALQELKNKYTMQAERDIHRASLDTSSSSTNQSLDENDTGTIELFDDTEPMPDNEAADEDLGDNIEFF